MLRPIESNLSILNVEQKANQIKDPHAHQFQTMQSHEIAQSAQQQAQTVPVVEKPEGDAKVRERRDDPEERRRKKKGRDARGRGVESEADEEAPPSVDSRGGLDFLA